MIQVNQSYFAYIKKDIISVNSLNYSLAYYQMPQFSRDGNRFISYNPYILFKIIGQTIIPFQYKNQSKIDKLVLMNKRDGFIAITSFQDDNGINEEYLLIREYFFNASSNDYQQDTTFRTKIRDPFCYYYTYLQEIRLFYQCTVGYSDDFMICICQYHSMLLYNKEGKQWVEKWQMQFTSQQIPVSQNGLYFLLKQGFQCLIFKLKDDHMSYQIIGRTNLTIFHFNQRMFDSLDYLYLANDATIIIGTKTKIYAKFLLQQNATSPTSYKTVIIEKSGQTTGYILVLIVSIAVQCVLLTGILFGMQLSSFYSTSFTLADAREAIEKSKVKGLGFLKIKF